jgi:hypothetical protein
MKVYGSYYLVLYLIALVLSAQSLSAETNAGINNTDRTRIAEARRLAEQCGDDIWEGWSDAPFAILLVTRQTEFLVYQPNPSDDFRFVGYDSLLGSNVYARERVFDRNLLATFPAVAGVSTIVIGQAEKTDASHSTRWVVTMLHEHFHQWQQSQPDYYPSTNALGLAGHDSSGMWMLSYPFPYASPEINEGFSQLCRLLREALVNEGAEPLRSRVRAYLDAKQDFNDLLSRDDYAYFSFQLWQEGIARYTEFVVAARAAAAYRPTDAFVRLPDYVSFEDDAAQTKEHILTQLLSVSLKRSERSAFYAVGAGEAMLLDQVKPGWRRHYLEEKFFTEKYFE